MNTEEFYEKLLNLNECQMKLVFDYGLRQIKYMFDIDMILEVEVPNNSQLIGLSVMGRFVAIDYENEIRYGYFPHNKTWSEATDFGNLKEFDSIEDFKTIYDNFELNYLDLNDLTHVVSKFKDEYTEWLNQSKVVKDHKTYKEIEVLVREVVSGKHRDVTRGSVFFHSTKVKPSWCKKMTKTVKIGDHVFYK